MLVGDTDLPPRFDSKLVRLKGEALISEASAEGRFDSKLVRLKDADKDDVYLKRIIVSIPNWFD